MATQPDEYRAAEQALWSAMNASPRERFVDLPKLGLRVRIQELGSGPPALFLHGVMTAGTAFAPLVSRLGGMRSIVLDRPGCGLSDAWSLSGPEFREEAVGVIEALLDALELESVALVGNSLGALWAAWFAIARPKRVNRLVLLGPSIGFRGVRPPLFMRITSLPGVGDFLLSKQRPSPAAIRRIFTSLGHGPSIEAGKVPEPLFSWGTRLMADTPTQKNDLQLARRAVGFFGARRWTMLGEEALRSIAAPTLLVSGDADPHGGVELARGVGALVPKAKVEVLPGGGHIPWLDDAAFVAEAIQRN